MTKKSEKALGADMAVADIAAAVVQALNRHVSADIPTEAYGFLDRAEQLGRHIILLGLGGS